MIKKRLLAFATAAVATLTLAVSVSAEQLVINVDDVELKEFVDNASSNNLVNAGDPTFTFVEGKGLMVSDRTADWNAVDFKFDNLEEGKKYRIDVEFSSDVGSTFAISLADDPYGEYVSGDADKTSDTLSYEFMLGSEKTENQNRMRLRSLGSENSDFYVKSVKVYNLDADGTVEEAVEEEVKSETDDTTAATPTKAGTPTGIESAAVIAAVALLAAGGIVIARKRK